MNNLELKDMEWTEDLFEPLDSSEQNSEFIAMESKTFLQDSWNRFKKNKLALVGLVFLVLMILMAIFVPMFSKYSYDQMDMTALNQLPSAQHWFGTDKFGRDIFVRVMYGARISLAVGFSAAIICLFIGVVYGGISGYVGGKVDMVMMRIVDIIYAIPSLLYVIFIMLIFGSNVWSILMGICVSSWVGMARLVRSQVLSLKEQEFALAAYVLGASTSRILFKHLILNCIGAIIVNVTLMVPSAIFTEAFLSFVGLGIPVPQCSLGSLISELYNSFTTHPYQIIPPIVVMSLLMLSFNLVADGLREALDPKMKSM